MRYMEFATLLFGYPAYYPYDRVNVIDDDINKYSSMDGVTMLLTDSAKEFDREEYFSYAIIN